MSEKPEGEMSSADHQMIYGVASSALQIEGAANLGGKVDSIWDRFCEREGVVTNGDTPQVACDHYHRWEKDLDLLKDLGVDAYRLSISWPRIMTSAEGEVNVEGLDFYQQIIDRLRFYNIKVFVTLYHWDLPQYLEEQGGWLNRETATAFAEYADVVSGYFGDQVSSYCTLNEPWCSAMLGYLHGVHAPGFTDRKMALQAAHHLLLAHGMAMPLLRANAPLASHGIVLNMSPYDAVSTDDKDQFAASFADAENNHWFLQPLLEGEYPRAVLERYPDLAPTIEIGDMALIAAPIDYLGVNYYTRHCVQATPDDALHDYRAAVPEGSEVTAMGWEVYPDGLLRLLTDLNNRYELPPVYITENGMASNDDYDEVLVNDPQRVRYLRLHLQAVHQAISAGVNVLGYFAWSLMDNFEWSEGYSKRFGLYYVDYATQERIPKLSARFYKNYIAERRNRKVE